MLVLFIDSCTERAIVSIDQDGQSLCVTELPFGFHNSELLVPEIKNALNSAQKELKAFDCIAVGVGPGSFTGMRVGAMIAKTLSYSAKVPLVGVSTLMGFVPDSPCRFAAVIDAKSGGVYYLLGEKKGVVRAGSVVRGVKLEDVVKAESVESVEDMWSVDGIENDVVYDPAGPQKCTLEELSQKLKGVTALISPNCGSLKERVEAMYGKSLWTWSEGAPDPQQMIRIAKEKFRKGEYSLDGTLHLLYLR